MVVGGVHLAERRRHHFHLWKSLDDFIDHAEEDAWIELRLGRDFRPGYAETLLQILFISDQHVNVFVRPAHCVHGMLIAAVNLPKLLAKIEIE